MPLLTFPRNNTNFTEHSELEHTTATLTIATYFAMLAAPSQDVGCIYHVVAYEVNC
jgi:hypothetical protein